MSDMEKYSAVSFKKDQIAALYFTMSDIVHVPLLLHDTSLEMSEQNPFQYTVPRPSCVDIFCDICSAHRFVRKPSR
jgi:hypothetical protein